MAANAPYYQLHPSQPHSDPFVSNITQTSRYTQPGDENYDVEPTAEGYVDVDPRVALEQENNQLAELLEAANEAAGLRDGAVAPGLRRKEGLDNLRTQVPQGRGKRKRAASSPQRDGDPEGRAAPPGHDRRLGRATSKRARKGPASPSMVQDPALGTMSPHIQHPIENTRSSNERASSSIAASTNTNANYAPFPSRPPSHDPVPTTITPSPDVFESRTSSNETDPTPLNPATALFRRPPANPPKKYTRPPMSKLFVSLQLAPENFLQLQAEAKAYMLDSAHPERQACVGNRGKGDTDMVKLRLFRCVNDFLVQGAGERFFGVGAEEREVGKGFREALGEGEGGAASGGGEIGEGDAEVETKWIWPRDSNKIATLVTPLLRRMVTNERQRMYAIETRKGGKRKEGLGSGDGEVQSIGMGGFEGVSYEQHLPHLDPTLATPISPHSMNFHHPHPQKSIEHEASLANANYQTNSEDLRVISIHFSSPDSRPLRPGLDLVSPTTDTWALRYAELCDIIERTVADLAIEQHKHGMQTGHLSDRRDETAVHDPDPALLRGLARAAAGLDTSVDANANLGEGGVRTDATLSISRPAPTSTFHNVRTDGEDLNGSSSKGIDDASEQRNARVEVLLSSGLSRVRNEEEWERAKREVNKTFWLLGRCTVVVTIGVNGEVS